MIKDAWQVTPPEVRQFIVLLATKLAVIESINNDEERMFHHAVLWRKGWYGTQHD